MTELERAVEAYIENPANYLEYQDGWEDLSDLEYVEKAFKAGAEWQKKHASEQAMKYLQEHHSPSELSDFQAAMNIAVAKAIDSTINKSIEWLKDNIHYDDFGGNMEWLVPFENDECMIQHFKAYMEE